RRDAREHLFYFDHGVRYAVGHLRPRSFSHCAASPKRKIILMERTPIDLGTEQLIFDIEGSIAWLTFNRPEARNAMTWAMYDGLVRACERVDADENIRLFILRGAGDKAFVSGTDISQFKAFKTNQDALEYEKNQNRNISRVETVQKPTIAMINGY